MGIAVKLDKKGGYKFLTDSSEKRQKHYVFFEPTNIYIFDVVIVRI